ncbi:MAG: MerC domain-containing protein [Phycisphaera sp.]|nr:MerC domain-containing protein [Phycisphaera sp.]
MSQMPAIRADLTLPRSQAYRDWIGVSASVLCAIHCAAMPFVVGLLPLLGLSFLADPSFHKWMVGICLALALLAFVPGWRRHHRLAPTIIGLSGLALISFAAFAGPEDCCATPCGDGATSTKVVSMPGTDPGVVPCTAACCDADSSTMAEPTDETTSCDASCCSTKDEPTAGPPTEAVIAASNETEPACTDTCCATEDTIPATAKLASVEIPAVAEDASCTAGCCPDSDETVMLADSGGFMDMVWLLMTPIGGVVLVAAHLTNHRLSSGCKAGCCSPGRDE